jgi:glyoxylase-like metal-dependent hydrolase (beta-lactamase superfamily II)
MKRIFSLVFPLIFLSLSMEAQAQTSPAPALPKATIVLAGQAKNIKIHTVVATPELFANTTHIIELPHQLLIVDGQFYAPYAQQARELAESLHKPITRFYISHDHPDHYLGFGDAFPDVPVYALPETKEGIEKNGAQTLKQRQDQFGGVIARTLRVPSHVQQPGTEIIDGVTFIFEKSLDNEAAASLIIKLPEAHAYIAQDIVYHDTHLFISGPTAGWRKALANVAQEPSYTLILPGHGLPTNRAVLQADVQYLDFVDKLLAEPLSKEAYKAKLLAAYPTYGGVHLIDIYLAYYLKKDWLTK